MPPAPRFFEGYAGVVTGVKGRVYPGARRAIVRGRPFAGGTGVGSDLRSFHAPTRKKALETAGTGANFKPAGEVRWLGFPAWGTTSTSSTRDGLFPGLGQEAPGGGPSEEFHACAEQPRMAETCDPAAVSAAPSPSCDLRHRQPPRVALATRGGNTTSSWEVQQRL